MPDSRHERDRAPRRSLRRARDAQPVGARAADGRQHRYVAALRAQRVLGIPARSQGGYRLYPPEAVGRVRLVRRALAIGFTLQDLAAVLSERDRGGAPCRSVRALVAERLAELETRLGDLAELRDELRLLLRDWDIEAREDSWRSAGTPPRCAR